MSALNGTLTIEAQGATWTLCFDFNAFAEFEDATGLIAMEEIARLEAEPDRMRVSIMRRLFWAGLQRHHPGATLQAAGDLMTAAPDALMSALNAAVPDQADIEGATQPGKPRTEAANLSG